MKLTMSMLFIACLCTATAFAQYAPARLPSTANLQDRIVSTPAGSMHKSAGGPVRPAATLNVPGTYATIAAAIAAASSGDIIDIAAGTYAENVTVDKSVEIKGAGQGATIIHPAVSNIGSCSAGSLGGSQVFVITASNVTIHDLTVDGDNPSLTSGTVVNGADIDARNGIIEGDPGPYNNTTVHHVTVKNIYLRGIYARSMGTGFNFHHNTVQNVAGCDASIAMFAYGASGTFADNTVSQANDAISANHSKGIQFLNNTVTNSMSGVHTDNTGDGGGSADLIRGNTVTNGPAGSYGVWVFVPYIAPTVEENVVTNVEIGLGAFGGDYPPAATVNTLFQKNSVNGQGKANSIGYYITNTTWWWGLTNVTATFSNNNVANNVYGLYLETGIDAVTGSKTVTLTAHSNAITGNTNPIETAIVPATYGGTGSAGTLAASLYGNWWGGISAPAVTGPSAASVLYAPWLGVGTDASGDPGFQPASPMTWYSNTNSTVAAAVAAVASGDALHLAAGIYVEPAQVNVNKSLTIQGAGASSTVLKAGFNTAGPGAGSYTTAGAFVHIAFGSNLFMRDVTIDGDSPTRQVFKGVQSWGTAQIENCDFKNIKYSTYYGMALTFLSGATNSVRNCTFWNYERIGVHVRGNASGASSPLPTAAIENCTFTGKGSGDWVEYGVEFGGGGNGTVDHCTMTSFKGVALSDGSTSAGILATDYYGAGTNATVTNSTLTGNSYGITVGYAATDATVLVAHNNNISGNTDYGLYAENTTLTLNAENNWWGSNAGPKYTTDGGATWQPAAGGDKVYLNVDFTPWMNAAVTTIGTDYLFDTDTDGNYEVKMNFSTLPSGGGTVFANIYPSAPAGYPAAPVGAAGLYLVLTSSMANYSFNVTVTLMDLPSGFTSSSQINYFNAASGTWVSIGGTYTAGPPATFTFTTNHFTPFVILNPANPLEIVLTDSYPNDTFDESTIAPAEPWQSWMGTADLVKDWSWAHQGYGLEVVPMKLAGVGQNIFAADAVLQIDTTKWKAYVSDVTKGTLFTAGGAPASLLYVQRTAGTGTNVLLEMHIAVNAAGNPQVVSDASSSLFRVNVVPKTAWPTPIAFADAKLRNNLNQAYNLNLADDGKARMYLGDVIWADPSPTDSSRGDGKVNIDDLNKWATAYFMDVSANSSGANAILPYRLKYDVGPTTTNYVDGLPEPDGKINFEDLVIFAISYGLYQGGAYPKGAAQSEPIRLLAEGAVAEGNRLTVPVRIDGAVADLRAYSLTLRYDRRNLRYAGVRSGEAMRGVTLVKGKDEQGVLTIDGAAFGPENSIAQAGRIAYVEFERQGAGAAEVAVAGAKMRDSRNRAILVERQGAAPGALALEQNYPNPFAARGGTLATTIPFSLAAEGEAEVAVYNVLGAKVAVLARGVMKAGRYEAQWNGRDGANRPVPAGLYLCRLTAGGASVQKTMMLVK